MGDCKHGWLAENQNFDGTEDAIAPCPYCKIERLERELEIELECCALKVKQIAELQGENQRLKESLISMNQEADKLREEILELSRSKETGYDLFELGKKRGRKDTAREIIQHIKDNPNYRSGRSDGAYCLDEEDIKTLEAKYGLEG